MSAAIRCGLLLGAVAVGIWVLAESDASAQETANVALLRPQVCSTTEPEFADESARWRLRAYNNLDCLIGIVDQALKRPADSQDVASVKLSREELEHMRNLAWWARDAAARIGR